MEPWRFIEPMDVVLGRDMSCCFFLTDRTLPAKVLCFGCGEGEGRCLNFFFKILVEILFFRRIGAEFWRLEEIRLDDGTQRPKH